MFKNIILGKPEVHIRKINSQGRFEGIIPKRLQILTNRQLGPNLIITRHIFLIILIVCGSILFLIEIILIILVLIYYSLEIIILVFGWVLDRTVRTVIVVILVVPTSVLVEHVNVVGVFYTETFPVC